MSKTIGAIGATDVQGWQEQLGGFSSYTVARNAATSAGVRAAAKNPLPWRTYHDTYSVSLSPTGEVTNQRQSGRCWLFSALNVVRDRMMSALGTSSLELSQAYLQFWDKLEKSNTFLSEMVRLADRPIDDREVVMWLQEPASDGGWWDSAAALIQKYGVVPHDCMPDTANSRATSDMNDALFRKLREDALILRKSVASMTEGELAATRDSMMAEVYRILAVSLGEPPARFSLEYVADARKGEDKKDEAEGSQGEGADKPAAGSYEALAAKKAEKAQVEGFTRIEDVTPLEFLQTYGHVDMADFVNIGNLPGEARPYGAILQMDNQTSLVGVPVRMLNMPIQVMKDALICQLKAGHPAWMACDVTKNMDRSDKTGLLDTKTLDIEGLFGMDFAIAKEDAFDLREAELNHAMTFQGVNLDSDGKPTAWRVENSWGKDACKDGYFIITDRWFDAYVGQAIIHRDYLPADVVALWDGADTPVIHVAPWAPMFGISD
jgi:bleomycin hydrolase